MRGGIKEWEGERGTKWRGENRRMEVEKDGEKKTKRLEKGEDATTEKREASEKSKGDKGKDDGEKKDGVERKRKDAGGHNAKTGGNEGWRERWRERGQEEGEKRMDGSKGKKVTEVREEALKEEGRL